MKSFFFLITFILISLNLFSQSQPSDRTFFYNEMGQKTTVKEKWDEDANGFKHGRYIQYDYSIIGYEYYVAEVGNYFHGKKQGEWKSFYSNGDVSDIGNYTNDIKSGKWKEHKDKGVYQEGYYSTTTGMRFGEWVNTNDQTVFLPKTEMGFRTIYSNSNGLPLKIFNTLGEDILLKQKQEEKQAEKDRIERKQLSDDREKIEEDFKNGMNKYQDKTFGTYFGDTVYLRTFLNKYPSASREYITEAKAAIIAKTDNDAFYFAKGFHDYVKYQKQFPNGLHKTEIESMIKDDVENHPNDFLKVLNTLLEQGKAQKVIDISQVVLRYKNDLNNAYYLPVTIYYSLALWSIGEKDKTIEVLKTNWNAIINYSDGSRKYKDKFGDIYNQYKKPLGIDNDKDTYKKIKSL